MQLATVSGGQPRVCSVYYVVDAGLNLYWLSFPDRRHSQQIAENNNIAITIPVKFDLPVIGIQAEGIASVVDEADQVELIMEKYVEKYNSGKYFYQNFINGKNKHVMYKFSPKAYILFDEVNYPANESQLIKI